MDIKTSKQLLNKRIVGALHTIPAYKGLDIEVLSIDPIADGLYVIFRIKDVIQRYGKLIPYHRLSIRWEVEDE